MEPIKIITILYNFSHHQHQVQQQTVKQQMINPTKRPTTSRPKSLKQKRDEEEFLLMKGLASSISARNKHPKQVTAVAIEVLLECCINSFANMNQFI